jgi:hypothetical protein
VRAQGLRVTRIRPVDLEVGVERIIVGCLVAERADVPHELAWQHGEAVHRFQRAIELGEDWLWLSVGNCLAGQAKYPDAIVAFEHAVAAGDLDGWLIQTCSRRTLPGHACAGGGSVGSQAVAAGTFDEQRTAWAALLAGGQGQGAVTEAGPDGPVTCGRSGLCQPPTRPRFPGCSPRPTPSAAAPLSR